MALIYAIPGFACTEKLFERLNLTGHQVVVLRWPEPKADYSLKRYAEQFLPQIDQQQKFYFLGVSFGGMISSELSEMVEAEGTILISSCKNRGELPWPLRMLKYFPLHKLWSEGALRWMASHSGWILGIGKELMPQLKEMMNSMPANYFKSCCNYIVNWNKSSNSKRLIHIHGKSDKLLWYSRVRNPDLSLENAGHGMIIYQAEIISNALTNILDNKPVTPEKWKK